MATATKAAKTATGASKQTSPQLAASQYAFPIKEITPLPGHEVRVAFSNGIQGRVDLSWVPDLPGYGQLRDPKKFRQSECISSGDDRMGERYGHKLGGRV